MATTQYIGSRYVPVFAEPVEWSSQNTYEALTIVTHEGNSYTSKQAVPKGIDISNEAYWAETGNYNAQVEQYRREVLGMHDEIEAIGDLLPADEFSTDATVKDYVDEQIEESKRENLPVFAFPFYRKQGDTELVKYDGKTLLIDTGSAVEYAALAGMLASQQVTSLDYIILTHYHEDHYGNIDNLIAGGFITSSTVAIIPPDGTYLDGYDVSRLANEIKNSLAFCNIVRATQNYTFMLSDMTVRICNASIIDYNAYLAAGQSYNDCSLITTLTFKHAVHITNGDASSAVMYAMMNAGYLPDSNIGLYKVGHHGDNRASFSFANPLAITNQAYQTLTRWHPALVVQTGGLTQDANNYHTQGYELSILSALGCPIYPTQCNTDGLSFSSDGYSFFATQGHADAIGSNAVTIRMYVDRAALGNTVQDGSEAHPFADLSQCLNTLAPSSNICYVVNVAPGEYNRSHATTSENGLGDSANNFSGSNFNIRIVGANKDTVKIYNNINWVNSYVWYENVSIIGSAQYTGIPVNIYLYGCDAFFNNCVFTSAEDDKGYAYIYARRSDVCVQNSTFNNYENYAMSGYQASHYTLSYDTFDSNVSPLSLTDGSSYTQGFDNTFTVPDLVRNSPQNNPGSLLATSITQPLITASTDWNTVRNPGIYGINSVLTDGINAPAASIEQGLLIVLPHARNTSSLHRVLQIYLGISGLYVRRLYANDNWSAWAKLSV